MGRPIAAPVDTIVVPLNGSTRSVVIDVRSMTLQLGHEMFGDPHIVHDNFLQHLGGREFQEILERQAPRAVSHVPHTQLVLIHLSPPYTHFGTIRMSCMPMELGPGDPARMG